MSYTNFTTPYHQRHSRPEPAHDTTYLLPTGYPTTHHRSYEAGPRERRGQSQEPQQQQPMARAVPGAPHSNSQFVIERGRGGSSTGGKSRSLNSSPLTSPFDYDPSSPRGEIYHPGRYEFTQPDSARWNVSPRSTSSSRSVSGSLSGSASSSPTTPRPVYENHNYRHQRYHPSPTPSSASSASHSLPPSPTSTHRYGHGPAVHFASPTIHPLLNGGSSLSGGAPVSYDVVFAPGHRAVYDRVSRMSVPAHVLAEPATHPPCRRLVVRCARFPWAVEVRAGCAEEDDDEDSDEEAPTPTHTRSFSFPSAARPSVVVSVMDVLRALHSTLHAPVTRGEYDELQPGSPRERRVVKAYEERCVRLTGGDGGRGADLWSQGVKRIDWLKGRTRFVGLTVVGEEKVGDKEKGEILVLEALFKKNSD